MADPRDRIVLPPWYERPPEVATDGLSLDDVKWVDKRFVFSDSGGPYTVTPTQFLIKAARIVRDGGSLDNVRTELGLIPGVVSDRVLNRAISYGMLLLDKAIAEGEEPAESRVLVLKEDRDYPED